MNDCQGFTFNEIKFPCFYKFQKLTKDKTCVLCESKLNFYRISERNRKGIQSPLRTDEKYNWVEVEDIKIV
jgi:hypothetical protein